MSSSATAQFSLMSDNGSPNQSPNQPHSPGQQHGQAQNQIQNKDNISWPSHLRAGLAIMGPDTSWSMRSWLLASKPMQMLMPSLLRSMIESQPDTVRDEIQVRHLQHAYKNLTVRQNAPVAPIEAAFMSNQRTDYVGKATMMLFLLTGSLSFQKLYRIALPLLAVSNLKDRHNERRAVERLAVQRDWPLAILLRRASRLDPLNASERTSSVLRYADMMHKDLNESDNNPLPEQYNRIKFPEYLYDPDAVASFDSPLLQLLSDSESQHTQKFSSRLKKANENNGDYIENAKRQRSSKIGDNDQTRTGYTGKTDQYQLALPDSEEQTSKPHIDVANDSKNNHQQQKVSRVSSWERVRRRASAKIQSADADIMDDKFQIGSSDPEKMTNAYMPERIDADFSMQRFEQLHNKSESRPTRHSFHHLAGRHAHDREKSQQLRSWSDCRLATNDSFFVNSVPVDADFTLSVDDSSRDGQNRTR